MAEQFNVRLPDELARAARVRAAELGVKPRDVVVEALEAFGLGQVPSTVPDRSGGRREKPRKAAESSPVAREAGDEPSGSACPECAGGLEAGVCVECGWRASPPPV